MEELAVDSGNQLITKDQLNKAQTILLKLNDISLKHVGLDSYYKELIEKVGEIKSAELLKALNLLKHTFESKYLRQNLNFELALVHGDFNAGQVLT